MVTSMAPQETTQAVIFSLSPKDFMDVLLFPLLAIFVTVLATLTTLIVQARQQDRDRRMNVLRQLLATRALPADPAYVAAVNLVPVEFNKVRTVMEAWKAYIDCVRMQPTPGNEIVLNEQARTKQTKLISAIMASLRLDFSEADIQADAYVSDGFIKRETLVIESLRANVVGAQAMHDVADALRAQTALLVRGPNANPPGPTSQP
jgi:hypothetical protein